MIRLRQVLKRYGSTIALDNISLDVSAGEIFGFLGPNGAGKSTAINLICGLVKPDEGEIRVDGLDIRHNPLEVKRRLGLVPQEIALFDTLTAWDNVEFFAKLAGLKGSLLRERVSEALEFAGLADKGKGVPKGFSGGMKRRLNIACAIAHRPKIIIMDEPTVGIDPQSRNHILESVRQLNKLGSTVIYTTHYMEEAEEICSRIGIIDHGWLVALGSKEELRRLVNETEKIVVETVDLNFTCLEQIKSLGLVKDAQTNGQSLEIVTPHAQTILQDILFILQRNQVKVRNISLVEPNLESVFLSLTGRKLRD